MTLLRIDVFITKIVDSFPMHIDMQELHLFKTWEAVRVELIDRWDVTKSVLLKRGEDSTAVFCSGFVQYCQLLQHTFWMRLNCFYFECSSIVCWKRHNRWRGGPSFLMSSSWRRERKRFTWQLESKIHNCFPGSAQQTLLHSTHEYCISQLRM